jgi:biopolymer transport protein ExbB/TolQ
MFIVVRADRDGTGHLATLRKELADNATASREHLITLLDGIISRERRKIEMPLSVLGTVGSTAPYVGLLGTVVGIIQSFQAIQQHNDMSPAVVSGGIATALIATAAGLAVAIPSVAAHHLLTAAIARRVEYWEEAIGREMPDHGAAK